MRKMLDQTAAPDCSATDETHAERVGWVMRLRWHVLILQALLCAMWFASHVQEKSDRGNRLNTIEQLGRQLTETST